jgi:hypothetical protein
MDGPDDDVAREYTLRLMPGWRRWPLVVMATWPLLMGYADQHGWSWWRMVGSSLGLLAIAVGIDRCNRCPQCRRFVRPRNEPTEKSGSWRRFYVCRFCRILWDPKMTWSRSNSG